MTEYKIRRDSLISPWGVGAIVPFPHDESLMVAGIDFWFDKNKNQDYTDFQIVDERLTKRLNGKLFAAPPDFRKPSEDDLHSLMKIPAVRFPRWQYCPVCGNMGFIGESGVRMRCPGDIRKRNSKETYCFKVKKENKTTPYMIPERFVAVCKAGHIEDFPIMYWVHIKSDMPIQADCKIVRSTSASTSSLAGIRYTCTCGASQTMESAFSKGALDRIGYKCKGNRPWLGENRNEPCDCSLQVVQRGASNVWFADAISSIYIPWLPRYTNQATKDCVAKGVNRFKSQLVNGEVDVESIRKFAQQLQELVDSDIVVEEAVSEIVATLSQKDDAMGDASETDYRLQEFDVLTRNAGKSTDELFVKNYSASEYDNLGFLKSISMVHKLRETRAFMGFKRLEPDSKNSPAISINEIPWLPAVKNSGEGIMLEFDYGLVENWAKNESVIKRVGIIEDNLRLSNQINKEQHINPIFILLHTFAHCLITALSNQSGYANASIREKIYSSKFVENEVKMAGILIYTASGDSEGSLGGLVRQATKGKFEEIIKRAILEARWCASDPVCIQSTGQGQNGCNLAACHNCAMLPETSCENNNRLLDRGLLIGTLDNTLLGFFSDYQ